MSLFDQLFGRTNYAPFVPQVLAYPPRQRRHWKTGEVAPLTENDVRRIVREELARAAAQHEGGSEP